jgi:DNA-binding Lrp family transcriptional regulator
MKNTELRLVCELMKNAKKSDRELAKDIGVSQPTVTRLRGRLEKDGVIKEYTMIPDFRKLGLEIMAVTFVKFNETLTPEMIDEVTKAGHELEKKSPTPTIMIMSGLGLGYDGVFISFHEDYSSFLKLLDQTKQLPFLDTTRLDSFLVSLPEEYQYRHLTLSNLANYLLKTKEEKS